MQSYRVVLSYDKNRAKRYFGATVDAQDGEFAKWAVCAELERRTGVTTATVESCVLVSSNDNRVVPDNGLPMKAGRKIGHA